MPSQLSQPTPSTVISDPVLALLLSCARTQMEPAIATQIQTHLDHQPDWPAVLKSAAYHGLMPLLYQNLQAINPEAVPTAVNEQLRHYAQSVALESAIYTKELIQICQLFAEHGIRVLPFKGPVLAVAVYGNLGLRHFGDLDLWVAPDDSATAIALLSEHQGYTIGRKWHYLSPSIEARYQRSWRECSLYKGSLAIDLHQSLTVETYLSTSFTFDDVWDRRTTVEISSYDVPSFCPDDLLMYLCIHGSKECWRSLKWICDLAQCVQAYPWDWDATLRVAQARGCERRLLSGLSLTHQLLTTPIPAPIQQRLSADPISQDLADTTLHFLLQTESPLGRAFSWEKFRLHLQSVERTQDKLLSLEELRRLLRSSTMKIFPNNRDYEAFPLPAALHWLYILLRPLRLLGRRLGLD